MATNTKLKLKKSSVAGRIPAADDLEYGELAINYADELVYFKNSSNEIKNIADSSHTALQIKDSVTSSVIKGFKYLQAPHGSVVTFVVTVATKDSTHRYNGQGSSAGYKIDGVFSPFLTLTPGRTYRFDQSHSSNNSHPINFYYDAAKTTTYSTDVTVNGSAGVAGAYTEITITDSTPTVLHYQCTAHGYMGNSVQTNSRTLTGFDTDNLSEGSSNLYYTDARVNAYVDSAYIQARQLNFDSLLDSSEVINLIDSDYIQARQVDIFRDSAFVTGIVDSAYVQARQDYAYSSLTGVPTNVSSFINDANYLDSTTVTGVIDQTYVTGLIDTTYLDSAEAISLIDSAYVQARQDYAYGSLTGAPTNVSSFINDANYLDSTTVTGVIDASYIQANQLTYDFLDSAEVLSLVDSAYIQARQLNFDSLLDSAATINLIDSDYINARVSAAAASGTTLTADVQTATSGQTSFTVAHTEDQILVFLNGILLKDSDDYASNGSTIVLTQAADSGDQLAVHNFAARVSNLDSSEIINLIDSDYIQARQLNVAAGGSSLDSSEVINLIDSDYIQARVDVVDDITPQLGGNLDVNGNSIVSVSAGNIAITPDTTGKIILDGLSWPTADGTANYFLKTDGAGNLSWDQPTASVANIVDIGDVDITTVADNDILAYDSSSGNWINQSASEAGITSATGNELENLVEDTTPQLGGNLDVNGNSIVSASGGNIAITPDTTGSIVLDGVNWPQADGTADQVLKTNGSGQLSWTTISAGGLDNVVEDTTPQLGGDLDLNSNDITGTGDINTTGTLTVSGDITTTTGTVTYSTLNDGTTALTSTVAELNLLDGVTGITLGTANELLVVGSDGTSIASNGTLAMDTSNNRLGINQSSPEVTLHMTGEGAQTAQVRMEQYNNSADAPDLRTRRYRGTIASPLAIDSGDYLYRSNHEYYNGSALIVGGQFAFDNTNDQNRTQFTVAVTTDGTSVDASNLSDVQFKIDGNDSGAITFNNAYKFPTSDGTANQVLQTDGSGQLSFATAGAAGGGIDSAATINLIDSDYINARVSSGGGGTNTSAVFAYSILFGA